MNIAIIGGGAAGFFSAISVKENYPNANVIIFEKSQTVLSKVKISGGGRCNVTNACTSISELIKAYPRGGKQLKKAFQIFNTKHTVDWFESRGVKLVRQDDDCIFPASQNSQSIIDCFLNESKKLGIEIQFSSQVSEIKTINDKLEIHFANEKHYEIFDKVIVTTGGSPQKTGFDWLEKLNHKIENPIHFQYAKRKNSRFDGNCSRKCNCGYSIN